MFLAVISVFEWSIYLNRFLKFCFERSRRFNWIKIVEGNDWFIIIAVTTVIIITQQENEKKNETTIGKKRTRGGLLPPPQNFYRKMISYVFDWIPEIKIPMFSFFNWKFLKLFKKIYHVGPKSSLIFPRGGVVLLLGFRAFFHILKKHVIEKNEKNAFFRFFLSLKFLRGGVVEFLCLLPTLHETTKKT